jgi:3-methyladenine DNA glycosylase AlkD
VDPQAAVTAARGYADAIVAALEPLSDPERATAMRSYMKDVAPFLGLTSPERRAALRSVWKALPRLDEPDLSATCKALWALPEREYQYAACDLIGRHTKELGPDFLTGTTEFLLTAKPWWDTVDTLGTAAVAPLVARNPPLVDVMWQWLESGDRWLIRAAIQHQRGRGTDTDVELLFEMCSRFAGDAEFFIAKAIGWALRDVTAWDPDAVRRFVAAHPELRAVARREAARGLARSGPP